MTLLQASTDAARSGGLELFDKLNWKFAIRLGIDLATTFIIIRGVYYRRYKRTDNFLTFFAFNVVIFLITFLLNKVEMTMGAAFGLFAVFSMLRYRTENITTKDMTYIFIVIAIGLVMAISRGGWDELGLIGLILISLMALLESNLLFRREQSQEIFYDRIELIKKGSQNEMIEDLKQRTGLEITRVEIVHIDLLKDAARLIVYYHQ